MTHTTDAELYPEDIENGAEPDDALNPHAVSDIPEAPAPEDALDLAYRYLLPRSHHEVVEREADRGDFEAGA